MEIIQAVHDDDAWKELIRLMAKADQLAWEIGQAVEDTLVARSAAAIRRGLKGE